LQPEDAGARRELGAVMARGGRPELALVAYRDAVRLEPASEDAHLGAAAALVDLERYAEAAQELRSSLELLPASGHLNFALARLLAASPDPSVRDGEQALELASAVFEARRSPSDAEVVAMALAELGRCEQAAEWHSQALEARRQQGEDPRRLAELEQIGARYQAGPPCRPPIQGNGSTATDTPGEGQ
jgi:tetratricopeptide (TPR) repeat protein